MKELIQLLFKPKQQKKWVPQARKEQMPARRIFAKPEKYPLPDYYQSIIQINKKPLKFTLCNN